MLEEYRNAPRTERCACGGSITALPWTVVEKIRVHQGTERHRVWRDKAGL